MAKKISKSNKSSKHQNSSGSDVVRIRATSQSSRKVKQADVPKSTTVSSKKVAVPSATPPTKTPKVLKIGRPVKAAGGYFKGAWTELRQVRWPNRRSTWSLTFAVLVYTAFFGTLVLLLDAGFKYLFELILGK